MVTLSSLLAERRIRRAAPLALLPLLFALASCDKDDWTPPERLSMLPPQPPIGEITPPPQFDACLRQSVLPYDGWGWFRARINGEAYVGPATVTEDPQDSGRYALSYVVWEDETCEVVYSSAITDLSPDPDDPYAGLPWVSPYYACHKGSPPGPTRFPTVRESRVQSFVASDGSHEYSRRYLPDTTDGLTLRIVLDDLDEEAGFVQGRFAAHYLADYTCPDLFYRVPNVYVEDGYFEATIRR